MLWRLVEVCPCFEVGELLALPFSLSELVASSLRNFSNYDSSLVFRTTVKVIDDVSLPANSSFSIVTHRPFPRSLAYSAEFSSRPRSEGVLSLTVSLFFNIPF